MNQLEPANFLKRIVALFIDLGVLYFIGYLISFFLGNYIMYFGHFKIIIGIVISTIYFTLMHSKLFAGKSIGKRLMRLQLIGLDGNYLSLGKSFLRSIIFTIPYCYSDLLNINFGSSIDLFQFVSYTIIPSLLLINHSFSFTNPMRQCFHDIVVKSVVTGQLETNQFTIEPINSKLKFLPPVLLLLIIISSVLLFQPFSEQNLKDIYELKTIESTITNNHSLYFSKLNYEFSDNEETNKTLKIECYFPKQDEDMSSEVYLLTEVVAPFKDKYKISKITLNVIKNYNIGIYDQWESIRTNNKKMKFDL